MRQVGSEERAATVVLVMKYKVQWGKSLAMPDLRFNWFVPRGRDTPNPAAEFSLHDRDPVLAVAPGEDVAGEPEGGVDVGAEVHSSGEDEGILRDGEVWVARLGAIGVCVHAVGDDGERKVRHEAAKGGGIGLGDGEDVIGAAADVGFVAAEAAGLEEGVGSAEPALWGAEVGEEGAVLEEVLAV